MTYRRTSQRSCRCRYYRFSSQPRRECHWRRFLRAQTKLFYEAILSDTYSIARIFPATQQSTSTGAMRVSSCYTCSRRSQIRSEAPALRPLIAWYVCFLRTNDSSRDRRRREGFWIAFAISSMSALHTQHDVWSPSHRLMHLRNKTRMLSFCHIFVQKGRKITGHTCQTSNAFIIGGTTQTSIQHPHSSSTLCRQ